MPLCYNSIAERERQLELNNLKSEMEVSKMEQWKDVEPNMWKPQEDGDQIQGVLVNTEEKDLEKQISAKYFLDTGKGIKLVWGCTILDSRMNLVSIGDKVRITYKGKTKNKKGQEVNLFKVEVAEIKKEGY